LQDYDANHDGVFNIQDFAQDPRVSDRNANGMLDAEDIILTFSDHTDADQAQRTARGALDHAQAAPGQAGVDPEHAHGAAFRRRRGVRTPVRTER